ncbi:hypothetical protein MMC12_005157 [Toensbergia leucococca]|nr:hypothetical protein [Toensbergia leucococca]
MDYLLGHQPAHGMLSPRTIPPSWHFPRNTNPPVPPDFYRCNQLYGNNIAAGDCWRAAATMPQSDLITTYMVNTEHYQPPNFILPYSVTFGSCRVSVQTSGPSYPRFLSLRPNAVRAVASNVIRKCPSESDGIGGFQTLNLQNLITYLSMPTTNLAAPYPPSSAFITVAISNSKDPEPSPGDTDSSVALLIADSMHAKERKESQGSELFKHYGFLTGVFVHQAVSMLSGSLRSWWSMDASSSAVPDEMTYECDPKLGSPATVDCAHIEWSELGNPSDTFEVRPGDVKFLSSNTCVLAISAAIPLVLTWAQVQIALSALMSICIQHPLQASQGGRAYFGVSTTQLSGRRARKRDNLSGLNALPPHANLTLFAQQEPFLGGASEANTCTWQSVVQGMAVDSCTGKI